VKIFWSSQARRDLRAVRAYIAKDSAFYAERMVTRIIERTEILSRHPNAGHPVHEAPDLDVREVHAASYRIIYRVLLDEVEIVTLVHFAQRLNTKRLR
jgi:addiction module RelE/StbE family toxin